MRRLHGFTLIEMLVVILVILILVGLLISGLHAVHRRAIVARARTEIGKLHDGIVQYKLAAGTYPPATIDIPSDPAAPKASDSFYQYLYFAGKEKKWFGSIETGTEHRPFWGPENRSRFNENNEYLDPWGRPYAYYVERESYERPDGSFVIRPRRFIVFSRGPNGKDETTDGPPYVDDVSTIK